MVSVTFFRPFPVVHDLCKCRSDTSCHAPLSVLGVDGAQPVVGLALVPAGLDERLDYHHLFHGIGHCGTEGRLACAEVPDLLLVGREHPGRIGWNVTAVKGALVRIGQHRLQSPAVGGHYHETSVVRIVENIEIILRAGLCGV